MDPNPTSAVARRDPTAEELGLHRWRVQQLQRLGLARVTAEAFADSVDWHAVAKLVERGCSPQLALEIVR